MENKKHTDKTNDFMAENGDVDKNRENRENRENRIVSSSSSGSSGSSSSSKYSIQGLVENSSANRDLISASVNQTKMIYFCDIELDDEQKYVVDCVVNRMENVFITGSSGVGKTELIPLLVKLLTARNDTVVVTSANINGATQLGGKTIQNFSGFHRLDIDYDQITRRCQMDFIKKIWNDINVLIIDDMSVLPPEEFKKLLYISQQARTVKKPLQWVLVGDFLSLAPINMTFNQPSKDKVDNVDFCVQLKEWSPMFHRTICLKNNRRQVFSFDQKTNIVTYGDMDLMSDEQKKFVDILEDIRTGAANHINWASSMKARFNKPFPEGIPHTKLMSKPDLVDIENEAGLKRLQTPERQFFSQKGWQIGNKVTPLTIPNSAKHLYENVVQSTNEIQRKEMLNSLERNAVVTPMLTLKQGAIVILMATLNHQRGLIKGSQGIVIGFTNDECHYPIVRFRFCTSVIRSYMWSLPFLKIGKMWYAQIPLRLGWAYNIRRMRGMTFDYVDINMGDMYGCGLVYEVLSKVRTLDGINFMNLNWNSVKTHLEMINYYDKNQSVWDNDYRKWLKSMTKPRVSTTVLEKQTSNHQPQSTPSNEIPTASFMLNTELQKYYKPPINNNNKPQIQPINTVNNQSSSSLSSSSSNINLVEAQPTKKRNRPEMESATNPITNLFNNNNNNQKQKRSQLSVSTKTVSTIESVQNINNNKKQQQQQQQQQTEISMRNEHDEHDEDLEDLDDENNNGNDDDDEDFNEDIEIDYNNTNNGEDHNEEEEEENM